MDPLLLDWNLPTLANLAILTKSFKLQKEWKKLIQWIFLYVLFHTLKGEKQSTPSFLATLINFSRCFLQAPNFTWIFILPEKLLVCLRKINTACDRIYHALYLRLTFFFLQTSNKPRGSLERMENKLDKFR